MEIENIPTLIKWHYKIGTQFKIGASVPALGMIIQPGEDKKICLWEHDIYIGFVHERMRAIIVCPYAGDNLKKVEDKLKKDGWEQCKR